MTPDAAGHAPAAGGATQADAVSTAAAGPTSREEPVVVRVDRSRCIGSGMCALTAPGSLALGADGLSRPVRESGPDGAPAGERLTEELLEAVDFCPVEALALHSALDGRLVAPSE
ncbi:ferredoxin [Kitasatospora sp. NPDC059327]|uniref:ferredoxin n=1 Tax=Kitasatospora sp. NPDC059327 TaxID=3346803 RepID=UPI00367B2405